jgi:hypothetical protein
MPARRFTARLEHDAADGGHWVDVPFDARAVWGAARPPVSGTVNGVPYRSRLAVYGGKTVLGLTKAVRAEAGVQAGDEVDVVLDRDVTRS